MATVGFPLPPARAFNSRPASSSSHLPAKHLNFRVQCSAEAAQDSATAAGEETVVGTSKRSSSSLISAENVQKALRGVAITNADHYGRLGLMRGCSYDQVTTAYEQKCEELRVQELDEEEASKQLGLLKESFDILSSEEERRLYDWSLARSEKPDRYMWPFEVDITQTPTEPSPPQNKIFDAIVANQCKHLSLGLMLKEPEDVGPTRLVGYFMLAWFILSVALSITLNR